MSRPKKFDVSEEQRLRWLASIGLVAKVHNARSNKGIRSRSDAPDAYDMLLDLFHPGHDAVPIEPGIYDVRKRYGDKVDVYWADGGVDTFDSVERGEHGEGPLFAVRKLQTPAYEFATLSWWTSWQRSHRPPSDPEYKRPILQIENVLPDGTPSYNRFAFRTVPQGTYEERRASFERGMLTRKGKTPVSKLAAWSAKKREEEEAYWHDQTVACMQRKGSVLHPNGSGAGAGQARGEPEGVPVLAERALPPSPLEGEPEMRELWSLGV